MIVLDADVLLIDFRYKTDSRFAVNRRAMAYLMASGTALVVPTQVIIEMVGVLCFGTPAADVSKVWPTIRAQYGLRVIPDPAAVPDHCGCTPDEIIAQMVVHKRAAGDATVAAQVEKYAAAASAFLTWNVKHFRGALTVPVLTPDE